MLRNLTIAKRIGLMLAVTLGFIGLLLVGMVLAFGEAKHAAAEVSVQTAVADRLEVSTRGVAAALAVQLEGVEDPAERVQIARASVRRIRYGEDDAGYFFVLRGTTFVAHAVKPELDGVDMREEADADGVPFVVELEKAARAGGGFVRYVFDKPGSGLTPKLAYAALIPGTDLALATGVYLDDVASLEATVGAQLEQSMQGALGTVLLPTLLLLVLVVIPLSVLVARSVVTPLSEAKAAMRDIAEGDADLTRQLDERGRDEVAELARAFNLFVRNLSEVIREVGSSSGSMTSSAHELAAPLTGSRARPPRCAPTLSRPRARCAPCARGSRSSA